MPEYPLCQRQGGILTVQFQKSPRVLACLYESRNGCRKSNVFWDAGSELPLSVVARFAKSVERAATLADIWVDTTMAVTAEGVIERYYPGRYDGEDGGE